MKFKTRSMSKEPIKGVKIERKVTENGNEYYSLHVKNRPLGDILQIINGSYRVTIEGGLQELYTTPVKRLKGDK